MIKDKASIEKIMQEPAQLEADPKSAEKPRNGKLITLPLALLGFGASQENMRKKLFLIKKFNLADPNELIRILQSKQPNQALASEDQKFLLKLWKETDLDDLDYAELFVSALPEIAKLYGPGFSESFDPQPKFHRHVFGAKYTDFTKNSVAKSANSVKRFALPRVRAKLAAKEIICLATSDPTLISKMIELSPRYLACPGTTELIARYRLALLSGNLSVKQKSEDALGQIAKSIYGKPKRSAKLYGYWKIDYYFCEILDCIKIVNKLQGEKRREYIKAVNKTWKLPEGYSTLLEAGTSSPAEITLEILTAKKMITDAATYRNVIKPHVKKLKNRYPYIRACDGLVEQLLDLPTKDPDRFAKYDLWSQLESFTFDLDEKELKVGHAISYPTYAIQV